MDEEVDMETPFSSVYSTNKFFNSFNDNLVCSILTS